MTELLCIGNALVDMFVPADFDRLNELGITQPVQHIPRDKAQLLFEKISGYKDMVIGSGGAAANVAKIAAMLGAGAVFTGCVGAKDISPDNSPEDSPDGELNFAQVFENHLRTAGVNPILSRSNEKTGLYFSFSQGKNIRIAASPGASLELDESRIPEDLITGAQALVLDGYMLDRRSFVQYILQIASHRGIPIAIDAASVFQIREKTEDILQYSRNYPLIIFMNADESITFYNTIKKGNPGPVITGEREKESFILKEICPVLKCITEGDIFPVIVIKLGGRGAVVLAGGNIIREETFAIIPKNTVGAGDAFCAAFITAWIRGKSIRECAALGNKVAKLILEVPGTKIKNDKLKPFAKQLKL